ncbi:MAG: histidine phosphatase family protein [Candidatus Delongbacteria bacterium]|jgi:broad specificity phosphatase PhoE|nr:histidine phosphatase family protein [Candidatus Delongbacteria bacterium]
MKIHLIRHAKTDANSKGLLICDPNEPLSDEGLFQAEKLSEYLKSLDISEIWCSSLPRAIQTIKPFLKYSSRKVTLFPELTEGQLNLDSSVLLEEPCYRNFTLPDSLKNFDLSEVPVRIPVKDETVGQFRGRVNEFIRALKTAKDIDSLLVITHGHYIREFLNMFLECKNCFRFPIKNCSETLIEFSDDIIIHHINKEVI